MIHKLIVLVIVIASISEVSAQTSGTLQVTTTTKGTGGNYAPKNIVAIWVENENGQFVKTLVAYANARKTYLYTWKAATTNAGSMYNIVDAVTGATRNSHGTFSCSWNGTDYKGVEVSDGTYKLRFELTDKHSTGNLASYTFTKGNALQELSPADVPSFTSTTLKWEPVFRAGFGELSQRGGVEVSFDPTSGQLSVSGVKVRKLEIFNFAGQSVRISSSPVSNLNTLPDEIYIIVVKTDTKTFSSKILKM